MTRNNILTASRIACWQRCPRLHWYQYELGYHARTPAPALQFGTSFHEAISSILSGTSPGEWPGERVADPFERARLAALVAGYLVRWGAKLEPRRLVGTEMQFSYPLIGPHGWEVAGKIDALLSTGPMEHKTTSHDISLGGSYWQSRRFDYQIGIYLDGSRHLGVEPEHCLYDVAHKPTLRPLLKSANLKTRKDGQPYAGQRATDESPEEYGQRLIESVAADPESYYQRVEITRIESEMEVMRDELISVALAIDNCVDNPPRSPGACMAWGHLCDFFEVCCGDADLDSSKYEYNRFPELEKS